MKNEVSYKEVEAMLYNYNVIKIALKDIDIEIESMLNEYQGIHGIGNNEVRPSSPTNSVNSTVENEVENKEKIIERLRRIKRSKELQIEKVDNMLQTLKDDERKIIQFIFFERFTVEKTSAIIDIATSTVRAKRNLSISSLAKFLSSNK